MDNSSPPADCHSHEKPTFLEPTLIMMQLSPAQADRIARRRRRNNDDPRLDRNGRRLRRMTEYSYPYLPPSHYLESPVYGEPAVVIPNQLDLPQDEEQPRHVVHLVYNTLPPTTSHAAELQVPLQDGATRVVCLSHMLEEGSHSHRLLLEDDEFYDRFVDDVDVLACEFGDLVKLVVPRRPAGVVGKVFLQYACLDAANLCKIRMDRSCWKGDEQIVARFYPEDKFAAGDYGSGH